MSIIKKRFSWLLMIFAAILIFNAIIAAQDFEATIKIASDGIAVVEAKINNKTRNLENKNWSFSQRIGSEENLGRRVSDFNLSDRQGKNVAVKKLADGEYLAAEQASAFRYQINLNASPNTKSRAHISWLDAEEQGILMLDDLLPKFGGNQIDSATIKFELPTDWKVFSGENILGENAFYVKNYEKAIFAVGKNWRELENPKFNLIVSGEWQFSDADALKMAGEICSRYAKLFGEMPPEKVRIFLARFPKEIKFGRWEAETRGSNLTILSSDMPFKTLSLQSLHEQLRHELFHLWIPNNLALKGNYDWFYEGFTVYHALRTGLAMNQIRFEDFLSTLAEAYNLDNLQTQKVSLVESSKNRWNSANPQVYARGMLIAFLCDLRLLKTSKNSRSINNLMQEIYLKHRVSNKPVDGNAAILTILKSYAELDSIVEIYIKGTENINWKTDLESAGIKIKDENSLVKLSVSTKLKGNQKDLLNELGYNNWRKSPEKSK
jgi:hypothetical protein